MPPGPTRRRVAAGEEAIFLNNQPYIPKLLSGFGMEIARLQSIKCEGNENYFKMHFLKERKHGKRGAEKRRLGEQSNHSRTKTSDRNSFVQF